MASAQEFKDLKTVFNSFDTDNSGSIDSNELGNVVEALGGKVEPDQIRKIMKQLDINKDGKISFQEFKFWWEQGHQGPLGSLVFLRAKSMKLTNSFLSHLSAAGIDLSNFSNDKPDSLSVDLQFGHSDKKGMRLQSTLTHGDILFKQRLELLKKEYPLLNPASFNALLIFGSDSADSAKTELNNFFNDLFVSDEIPLKFEDYADNEYISLKVVNLNNKKVAIHMEIKEKAAELLGSPLQQIDQINHLLGQNSAIRLHFDVAANFSIDQLLQHKNLIQTLSKGLSLKAEAYMPGGLIKKMKQLLQNMMNQQQMDPPMLLQLLLKSMKLKLKLRSPEQIDKFFQKLGIKELLTECPNLEDLLQQLSMFPEVAELKLHVQSPKHFIYRLLKMCNTHVSQEIKIYIQRKETLFEVSGQCPNLSKIYKSIFNEI